MKSLLVLLLSILIPWLTCGILKRLSVGSSADEPWAQERALARYRPLLFGFLLGEAALSAVTGACYAESSFLPNWPVLGAWFFSSLSLLLTIVSFSLLGRTNDEAREMPEWEAVRRAIRLCALPVSATLLCVLLMELLGPLAGPFCVAAIVLVSPRLLVATGAWRTLSRQLHFRGRDWRIVHLPLPNPLLVHVAAVPWLGMIAASDGLLRRLQEPEWSSLARYELSPESGPAWPRIARWASVLVGASCVFCAAGLLTDKPRALVATTSLAVLLSLAAIWRANRQSSARAGVLPSNPDAPSAEELARALRALPPLRGQAFPRTSHRPLDTKLYDRLFALGYDPGPRPAS